MSADVLMQMFLDVCCDELLLYYAASGAVLRSNCNFEISRDVTEIACQTRDELLQLRRIRPTCCEDLFLYYCAAHGAFVDTASLRASFRRTWSMLGVVRACPNLQARYLRRTYSVRTLSHKGICGRLIP